MAHPEELQTRWKAIASHFRAWTLPIDLVFDPASYGLWGADLLPSMMNHRRARAALAHLEGADEKTLESLSTMATVNAQRSGDVFKGVATCYITLPIALTALLSDAAPEQTRAFLGEYSGELLNGVIALALGPVIYFMGHWRAKQIAWTIELYRAGAMAQVRKPR